MNKQPEALRLADALDDLMGEETLIGAVHIDKASYELRRLHEENERLREALKRQAAAALTGMDAAKSIARQDLERAKQFYAESAPDALESERAANFLLTTELQQVETERDTLKVDNDRLREEVRVLRLYGNKDCTSMADEALKQETPR